ncbi:quinone-dependent dihydroorotate dehydrogenase [soil metagenome]
MLYRLLRPLLFRLPAETAHALGTGVLERVGASAAVRRALRSMLEVRDPRLEVERWGIRFPNPVGVAAGLDKDGTLFNPLGALGFGSVEIGTITAHAQAGNPRPRLFRLPRDRALLNRMGFNNPGAGAVAQRLADVAIESVLGINLGKSRDTPLERATEDYLRSLELLEPFARYLVVNVSSPNTPGLRGLQRAAPLRALLRALLARSRELAQARGGSPRPLLVKLSPDLDDDAVDAATALAAEEGAAGIIAANTTREREGLRTPAARLAMLGDGGVSGKPLRKRMLSLVRRIHRRSEGRLTVVAVGGIFSAGDAYAALRAGAALVQLYTGFVYVGPTAARDINRGLLRLLERDGFASLEHAIGRDG